LQYYRIQGIYHQPLLLHCLTIIARHETFSKQVGVKDFPGRVSLLFSTWTTHQTIMNICPSHIAKITKALNVLGSASVTVHPLSSVHLHHIIKFTKNYYRTSWIVKWPLYIETCIVSMTNERIELLTLTEEERKRRKLKCRPGTSYHFCFVWT
jgi:hypothetical protein